jgi:hypothetical protein
VNTSLSAFIAELMAGDTSVMPLTPVKRLVTCVTRPEPTSSR